MVAKHICDVLENRLPRNELKALLMKRNLPRNQKIGPVHYR